MENISTESVSVLYKLNNNDNENDEVFLKECWIAIKIVPVILLTLVTLIGNGLVIVMFARSKQLRKCKNIYIVSLAMADFLIGCTMPVFILEEIGLSMWILQGTLCRVFLMFRYSLFYISLLSIMLISVDRWWSINHPFSYRVKQSRKLALWSVLCSWLLSFAIYAPPTLGWEEVIDNSANDGVDTPSMGAAVTTSATPQAAVTLGSTVPGVTTEASIIPFLTVTQCRAPFENNLIFNLLTAIVLYLIPLISLWIMNASIYFKISQRKGMKIRRSLGTSDTFFLNYRKSSSESDNMGQFDEFIDAMIPVIYRKAGNATPQTLSNGVPLPYSNEDKRHSLFLSMRRTPLCQSMATAPSFAQYARINQKRHVSFDANGMFLPGLKQKRLSSFILAKGGSTSSNSSSSSSSSNCSSRNGLAFRRQSDDLVKDMFVKQDKKAACSLGVLVIVFTLCWTPHTVCSIIKSSYGGWYIPSILLTVTYCILATNSAINPFLYGLCNSDFRKAFRSWCRNRKSRQRRFEEALLYYGLPQVYEPEIIPEQSTSTPTKEPKEIP